MTALKTFSITSIGREVGVYNAADADAALLAHINEQGFKSFEEAVEKFRPIFGDMDVRDHYQVVAIEDLNQAA